MSEWHIGSTERKAHGKNADHMPFHNLQCVFTHLGSLITGTDMWGRSLTWEEDEAQRLRVQITWPRALGQKEVLLGVTDNSLTS